MSDPTENPSQLHGHATYIAGAAKSALGFESGAADKEYAVSEMRAAKEQAEASGTLLARYSRVPRSTTSPVWGGEDDVKKRRGERIRSLE